jgi:5-(carboxyamino)imidazole ribonucleotide mutase
MPIDKKFAELVESDVGCAVVIAGSGSDDKRKDPNKPSHIERIAASLGRYEIPFQVRVASGHKQGEELQALVDEYDSLSGGLAYIVVAGNTDAISGITSFRSYRPTVSCPPDHPNLSCINNPPGSSNSYVGNPDNAGRFVAQMFADRTATYKRILLNEVNGKREELEGADDQLMKKYDATQGR